MLVTFELLEVEQSYIPLLKALMCGIDAVEAQGCGCMFTFCHAYLKMGVLLHKMAIICNQKFMAVHTMVCIQVTINHKIVVSGGIQLSNNSEFETIPGSKRMPTAVNHNMYYNKTICLTVVPCVIGLHEIVS